MPGGDLQGPRPGARGAFAAVRLLRHSRRWAAALMGPATGGIVPDRTHRLLTRMGFGLSGGNYAPAVTGPPASARVASA